MYKELAWNKRIFKAGGEREEKRKTKKCHHGTVAFTCYLIGAVTVILLCMIYSWF